jgi:hypothetical protein
MVAPMRPYGALFACSPCLFVVFSGSADYTGVRVIVQGFGHSIYNFCPLWAILATGHSCLVRVRACGADGAVCVLVGLSSRFIGFPIIAVGRPVAAFCTVDAFSALDDVVLSRPAPSAVARGVMLVYCCGVVQVLEPCGA